MCENGVTTTFVSNFLLYFYIFPSCSFGNVTFLVHSSQIKENIDKKNASFKPQCIRKSTLLWQNTVPALIATI